MALSDAWVVLRDIDLRESGGCSAPVDNGGGEDEGFDARGVQAESPDGHALP